MIIQSTGKTEVICDCCYRYKNGKELPFEMVTSEAPILGAILKGNRDYLVIEYDYHPILPNALHICPGCKRDLLRIMTDEIRELALIPTDNDEWNQHHAYFDEE